VLRERTTRLGLEFHDVAYSDTILEPISRLREGLVALASWKIVIRPSGSYIPCRDSPVSLCVSCSLSTTLDRIIRWLVRISRTELVLFPHRNAAFRLQRSRTTVQRKKVAGVGPTECHVSTGRGSPKRARWLLISFSPGRHELHRPNDRALFSALGWIAERAGCHETIHLPSQSDSAHHLHFRRRARRAARQGLTPPWELRATFGASHVARAWSAASRRRHR
jgi:hypothetical protein